MKKQILLTSACIVALALSQANATEETYPEYYKTVEKIQLKDSTGNPDVTKTGIMTYGFEDVEKASGHVCPATTGAFLMTREALKELAKYYKDNPAKGVTSYDVDSGLMYRGGLIVTMSGKPDSGGPKKAMASVTSFITGATGADGIKGGNVFPFANRRNLLRYDESLAFNPKTGIQAIFTSLTSTYEKKDDNGEWKRSTYDQCQGTQGKCRETTQCDKSVKVTYHFKSPNIIGKDPKAPMVTKIKNILDNSDKAIKVESIENPAATCTAK